MLFRLARHGLDDRTGPHPYAGEYTFTARAGTAISEIAAELARHGQYLPFDPLLAEAGATLGGSIAAGLSGPALVGGFHAAAIACAVASAAAAASAFFLIAAVKPQN